MTHLARVAVVTALAFPFSTGIGHAASQTILGSKFLVKDPGVATKRKVTGSAKESGSPNTIVGNPTTGGASLRVIANGGTDSDQTFALPAGGWSASGSTGYKYSNKTTGGAAKKASIKRTPSGTFLIKMSLSGKDGPLAVVPPNPGDDGGFILTITGGDSYCVAFGGAAGGTEKKDDAKTWMVIRPTGEACPSAAPPPTTTSTTATVTTSTSTSTSTIAGSTTTSTTAGTTTTTTTLPGSCPNCCAFTKLRFTTTVGGTGDCGDISPGGCAAFDSGANAGTACSTNAPCGAGTCIKDITCGGLYFGGGNDGVPLPATVPDMGRSVTSVQNCNPLTGAYDLGATTATDTGSILDCTSAPGAGSGTCVAGNCSAGGANGGHFCTTNAQCGCLFGAPLPIPNPNSASTSTCVINSVSTDAAGSGTCSGDLSNLDLPLNSEIYLVGDGLPKRCSGGPNPGGNCLNNSNCSPGTCVNDPDIQPCPICNPTTHLCNGGFDDGSPCTPETGNIGPAFPTSHDCRPNPPSLGGLAIGFKLSSGTQTKGSANLGAGSGQQAVFQGCGGCASAAGAFEGPPTHQCSSNAECTTANFPNCQQRTNGAFSNPIATSLTANGSPAGCQADGAAHASTLVSLFCVPHTGNVLVDVSADLPGPGAVALVGVAQMTDAVATTTTTTSPGGTTTTTLIPCSGIAPACTGSCPIGMTCGGATASPCTCS